MAPSTNATTLSCVDCIHRMLTRDGDHGCAHPEVGIDQCLVTGDVTAKARCLDLRSTAGVCGPEGALYAPTDEAIRRPVCKNLIRAPYARRPTTPACCVDPADLRSESTSPSKASACSGCAFSPNSH